MRVKIRCVERMREVVGRKVKRGLGKRVGNRVFFFFFFLTLKVNGNLLFWEGSNMKSRSHKMNQTASHGDHHTAN